MSCQSLFHHNSCCTRTKCRIHGSVTIPSIRGTLQGRLAVAGLVLSLLTSATGFTPAARTRTFSRSMEPAVPWLPRRELAADATVGAAEDSTPNFSGEWAMDLKASDSLLPILSVRRPSAPPAPYTITAPPHHRTTVPRIETNHAPQTRQTTNHIPHTTHQALGMNLVLRQLVSRLKIKQQIKQDESEINVVVKVSAIDCSDPNLTLPRPYRTFTLTLNLIRDRACIVDLRQERRVQSLA